MERFDHWMPENIQYAISPPNLEDLGSEEVTTLSESGGRHAKNAAVLSLQKAVDGIISGETDQEEYERIKQEASEAVIDYYAGDEVKAVETPSYDFSTRQSGFLTHEAPVRHFPDQLADYNKVDTVVPVASGGLEPGVVASEELDAEMKVLRYSTNDHGDEQPVDIEGGYRDENILVVDDTSYSGETLETVEDHLRGQGAGKVESEAVIQGQMHGTATLTKAYLKDIAGVFR